MLLLDRKKGQAVVIDTPDGPVFVHVVRTGPTTVRLGFDAPKTVVVDRTERRAARMPAREA